MNIILLKKFYSVNEISQIMDLTKDTVYTRIRVLEIKPDLMIKTEYFYSEESKNKIIGYYEFEKNFTEIYYQQKNKPKDNFIVLESKMNF
jgi:predicted transcriptional regulator